MSKRMVVCQEMLWVPLETQVAACTRPWYIYIPRTVRHTIPWRYILTLYCQTLVSLPGLTCHAFCWYFIAPVTMCSSQFPVTVPIYLPWSSVFTLSRGPLWLSIISCFFFFTMWGCYPSAFPRARELPLVMCPLLIIHCNTCSYVHISRPSLHYWPEAATHSWGKGLVQHGLLKYCSYVHMTVCVVVFFFVFLCDSKTQVNLIYMKSRINSFL
jgi:hypothetical protein